MSSHSCGGGWNGNSAWLRRTQRADAELDATCQGVEAEELAASWSRGSHSFEACRTRRCSACMRIGATSEPWPSGPFSLGPSEKYPADRSPRWTAGRKLSLSQAASAAAFHQVMPRHIQSAGPKRNRVTHHRLKGIWIARKKVRLISRQRVVDGRSSPRP